MKPWTKALGTFGIALVLAISAIAGPSANAASPAPVALGDAARFAVLASAALTNSAGATVINGNVGWGTAITGFTGPPLGTVTGTTDGPTPAWQLAHDNLVSAYGEASTRAGATAAPANDLGGKTLTAGFYDSLASGALSMTADLTLDGGDDPNAVFIIRTAAALDTTATVHVNLTRGARACNVFWVVGAATTLGAGTTFKGNIISFQAITLGAGTTIDGRALSVTAAVTLDTNTITWCDTTVPTITAPPNVNAATAPGDTSCSAFVSDATLGAATASDNSAGPVTITRGPVPAGNLFAVGTTGITYTATDPADNSASASQLVTITDGTPPVMTNVPTNAGYQFLSDVPAANANSVTATDNCGAPTKSVLDTNNGGAGTPASPLIITRTFKAIDAAGNTTTAAQTITVVDNIPPTITAPADNIAFTGPGALGCEATVSDAALGSAIASDNSGSVIVTRSPTLNNFPVGVTTVTYTATDSAGNTASATQLVTITDNTVPTISIVPATASYQLLSDVPAANVNDAIADDNCGPPSSSVLDTDNGGLGTPASPLIITRTFKATDAAGNSVTAAQTITVVDTTPSPTPTPSPSPTPSPTPTPTPTPTPSPSPAPSATPSPTPTPSPAPSATPSPTPSPTPTPSSSPTPTPSTSPAAPPLTPSAALTSAPLRATSTPAAGSTAAPTFQPAVLTAESLPSTSTVDGSARSLIGVLLAVLGGLLLIRSRARGVS
jgi:trimeric autotransporter adhesin